jgi:hypothetical protein
MKKTKHVEKAYLVARGFVFDQGSSWKKNQKLITSSTTLKKTTTQKKWYFIVFGYFKA